MYFTLYDKTEADHQVASRTFKENRMLGLVLVMSKNDWNRLENPDTLQIQVKTYHEPITLVRDS